MNLTDEQLNIAICEWRGWRDIRRPQDDNYHELSTDTLGWLMGRVAGIAPDKSDHRILPSHITGIEALGNIHEAEKGLMEEQLLEYERHLRLNSAIRWPFHATARQRAIALLRVIKPMRF